MKPKLEEIVNGWAALSATPNDTWAVHGATREEALMKFSEAVARHIELEARYKQDVVHSEIVTQ